MVLKFKIRMHMEGKYACAVCGWTSPAILNEPSEWSTSLLEAHHCKPAYYSNDHSEDNLLLLCPNHHAIADVLCMRKHNKPPLGLTDKEELLRSLKLLDSDPVAWEAEFRAKRETEQAELTDKLSAMLHDT